MKIAHSSAVNHTKTRPLTKDNALKDISNLVPCTPQTEKSKELPSAIYSTHNSTIATLL